MSENIPRLVGEALHKSADLAQKELALFRTDMSDNVRTIAMSLVTVIAAAVFAILSLIWLTQALVDWLATKLGPHALAALMVGGVLAVVAIGLSLYGRSAMVKTSLVPRRTIESLERDAGVSISVDKSQHLRAAKAASARSGSRLLLPRRDRARARPRQAA